MAVDQKDFEPLYHKHFEAAYRLAFLLCRHPAAAESVVLHAMLALAARPRQTPENDTIILIQLILEECDGYYLKKPHRLKKREELQKLVSFPISDALWQAMKLPFNRKAAFFLRDSLHFMPAEIAQIMHKREAAVNRLLSGEEPDLSCAAAITADDKMADSMLDDIYTRFVERSVAFELKLRRIKRRIDKAVPYIAAAVILFCIAAVIYTANLPVS